MKFSRDTLKLFGTGTLLVVLLSLAIGVFVERVGSALVPVMNELRAQEWMKDCALTRSVAECKAVAKELGQ